MSGVEPRKDTVTLVLDGEVTLEAFATAYGSFVELIKALADEVAPGSVPCQFAAPTQLIRGPP